MTERIGVSEFDIPLGIYVPIEEYNKIKQQRDKLIEEYDKVCRQLDKLREVCEAALEWFAQYPFNNAQFERQTANEMYDNLQAVLDEVEDSDV